MNKIFVVILVCTVSLSAFGDDWFCTEESSSRSGHVFSTCGVGEATTESLARQAATDNARLEFDTLCNQDVICKAHDVSVNPKRQSCSQLRDGSFKCNRLIEYTISDEQRKVASPGAAQNIAPQSAKIRKGMSKAELLATFGKPDLYIDAGNGYLIFNYTSKEFCTSRCTIGLDHDRVYKFDGFEIGYTDVMETRSVWSQLFH